MLALLGKAVLGIGVVLALLLAGASLYYIYIVNPKVVVELQTQPTGQRAQRVMLLTLPSGSTIPVNYLKEGSIVYVGADGRWWRDFRDPGEDVEILVQGVPLKGHAIAITNDRKYRDEVFKRLRPTAPTWFPEWAKGVLIEITVKQRQ